MQQKNAGFSLIELMTGIVITSFVMIAGFQTLSFIGIGKIKLIERTKIQQEAYFSAEKLFELIKTGGKIDYEEYWNRYSYDTSYSSGHFLQDSDFGNVGVEYFCMSSSGTQMGTGGCLSSFNIRSNSTLADTDYAGAKQSYNRYKLQFRDYNSDADGDLGNEKGSTIPGPDFIGDDDDVFLGAGPKAFPYSGSGVTELYLINSNGTERTFFRWFVTYDPYDSSYNTTTKTNTHCDFTLAQFPTGTGCLGTIQMLKLTGVDEDYDHGAYGGTVGGYGDDDGEIDTWLIHKDFDPLYASGTLAGTGSLSYWQNIFPDTINVKDVAFHLYPHTELAYAWKDSNAQIQVAPYLQMKMTLQPSMKEKRRIKGVIPDVKIATTIHLSDLNFQ